MCQRSPFPSVWRLPFHPADVSSTKKCATEKCGEQQEFAVASSAAVVTCGRSEGDNIPSDRAGMLGQLEGINVLLVKCGIQNRSQTGLLGIDILLMKHGLDQNFMGQIQSFCGLYVAQRPQIPNPCFREL